MATYCIVSYRIVSYRIVSYRIVSYRIVSYRIVSYRIVSYCEEIISHYCILFSPALDGAAVGMRVTAVGGLATGEADGLDVTSKVTITLLITLLSVSAMYIMPEDASMTMLYGSESIASVAGPPSPMYPVLRVPTTVVIFEGALKDPSRAHAIHARCEERGISDIAAS